jgi:hypothetical protein
MSPSTQKRIINRLLTSPASEWPAQIDRLLKKHQGVELLHLTSTMNSITEQLAWLAEYLEWRGGGHLHPRALKAAVRRQIKVSRALGYSHPERRAYLS